MIGPFVHNIDPIIFSIGGVHIWFYGLSFTLGFLNAHLFLRRNRERIGLSLSKVYELTLFLAVGVSIGGRALVVINNEWDFYREYPNTLFGMPNGQAWNLMTVALGIILLAINLLRSRKVADVNDQKAKSTNSNTENPGWRRAALFVVCLIPLVIPSDATRDVPVSYGERHPALEHSWMYPPIADQLEKHAEKIEH
ncbi:MAG: prolipoprotein diacylglyceryl transferase [Pyrinomonadaceae bacterium]|nr:prolipoprotein diacylglyceryl transferase [Pyrinomonadaceae bacterium]